MKQTNIAISGHVEPGFEAVREAFIENFLKRNELGAACCIYYQGKKVVDIWGGIRNKRTGEPWEENTMVLVFSATKGMSGLAIALAHSRGLLDYEERVSMYWPEFAQQGKVLKIIKNYIDAGITDPIEIIDRQKKIREDAVSRVLKHIQNNRLKKKSFSSRLENYERFLALREENRYHIVMVVALARRIYLEIGRRFAERGILEKQHDIFFLTLPEVQNLLIGEKNGFKNIVNERKLEKERNSRLHVPDVIAGDVVPEAVEEKARETKKVFEGYAASPGIVQGRARIIRSHEEFGRFKPGEILVAPTTDPMWSSLFPVAKAVVTEMGGILSHAAIVAREYGTPCVVNVQGVIDALEDGDLIEVDGKSGIIKILETANLETELVPQRRHKP